MKEEEFTYATPKVKQTEEQAVRHDMAWLGLCRDDLVTIPCLGARYTPPFVRPETPGTALRLLFRTAQDQGAVCRAPGPRSNRGRTPNGPPTTL